MKQSLSTKNIEGDDDGANTRTPEELLRDFDSALTGLVQCGIDSFETVHIRINTILEKLEKDAKYNAIIQKYENEQNNWYLFYDKVKKASAVQKIIPEKSIKQILSEKDPNPEELNLGALRDQLTQAINGFRELYLELLKVGK